MFYVFYVFSPLVYQQFFIKNHIWLVIRQRMSKCVFGVFYVSLCFFLHSNFLNWFVFYVFFVFFLPSPPNFSCYVFSVFSFLLIVMEISVLVVDSHLVPFYCFLHKISLNTCLTDCLEAATMLYHVSWKKKHIKQVKHMHGIISEV